MKYGIWRALAGLVFFAGSGTANPLVKPAQEFNGRLEFYGEFTLFPFPASSPRAKECISGALPLAKHRRAQRLYGGKTVSIRGRMVPYSSLVETVGATERGWKGTPIPNYCGGEYVILADKVRLMRARDVGD